MANSLAPHRFFSSLGRSPSPLFFFLLISSFLSFVVALFVFTILLFFFQSFLLSFYASGHSPSSCWPLSLFLPLILLSLVRATWTLSLGVCGWTPRRYMFLLGIPSPWVSTSVRLPLHSCRAFVHKYTHLLFVATPVYVCRLFSTWLCFFLFFFFFRPIREAHVSIFLAVQNLRPPPPLGSTDVIIHPMPQCRASKKTDFSRKDRQKRERASEWLYGEGGKRYTWDSRHLTILFASSNLTPRG